MLRTDVHNMTAATMLDQLKQVHAAVRDCLAEMEGLTGQSSADRLEYTSARFRISRASMRRRTCFNNICAEVSKNASLGEASVIARLKETDRELMSASAVHIAKWTGEQIQADWLGYCEASKRIRHKMAVELEAEQTLLFPLLKRRSIALEGRSRAA